VTDASTSEIWAAVQPIAGTVRDAALKPRVTAPIPDQFISTGPNSQRSSDSAAQFTFQRLPQRPLRRVTTIAALASQRISVAVDSAALQIWEGTVTAVDFDTRMMDVLLTAKMTAEVPHTAGISLEWVTPQDMDLVRPGAVFYLTLFKKTRKGSIQNSQELRFRRRPSWSRRQIELVRDEAELLARKMVPRPLAE
jgi:hypothetical protein